MGPIGYVINGLIIMIMLGSCKMKDSTDQRGIDRAGSGSPTPPEGVGGSKSTNYPSQTRPILDFKQSLTGPTTYRSFCITGQMGRMSDPWLQTYL